MELSERAVTLSLQTVLRMRGKNVVFRSGEQNLSLRAAPDAALRPIDTPHAGLAFSTTERDWVCFASALQFGGAPHLPEHGDLIADFGSAQLWEVQPNERSQCFDLEGCDLVLRIHTKRVVA